MKNSEKFNSVNGRVQTQFGISHPIRTGLAALVLPMIISACATEAQFLAAECPSSSKHCINQRAIRTELPSGNGYSTVSEGHVH